MSTEFYWIAVAAVTVLSAARLTRLAVYDDFPPVKWLRNKYTESNDGSDWSLLALCGFCASFWITALVVVTGLLADVYGDANEPVGDDAPWFLLWWIVNGTFAASYLAASYVARDGDDS